jgi:hypothetical protein
MPQAAPRSILHVDMDAFYASVEALDNPALRGKPLIVGGLGGRGVVAAASYEVRRFGVHSAMPMREALQRCPDAMCVPPRFERYKEISEIVFGVFHEFTPIVEGLSLDEAFLDVTHSRAALGSAESIAVAVKRRILERTGVTASVGVAPNKLVAKIASDLRKPDGLVIIPLDQVTALLDPLSIRKLFGIGNKTAPHLEQIGIRTLRDLRQALTTDPSSPNGTKNRFHPKKPSTRISSIAHSSTMHSRRWLIALLRVCALKVGWRASSWSRSDAKTSRHTLGKHNCSRSLSSRAPSSMRRRDCWMNGAKNSRLRPFDCSASRREICRAYRSSSCSRQPRPSATDIWTLPSTISARSLEAML